MFKSMFLLATALFLTMTIVANGQSQAQSEDCPFLVELESEVRTHLVGRDERMRDLSELMDEMGGNNLEDDIYELMYWAAMADSAATRAGKMEYPLCETYTTLNTLFHDTISDVYAMASQTSLLLQGRLSDFQVDNVTDILEDRITSTAVQVGLWTSLYAEINSQG